MGVLGAVGALGTLGDVTGVNAAKHEVASSGPAGHPKTLKIPKTPNGASVRETAVGIPRQRNAYYAGHTTLLPKTTVRDP